MRWRVAILVSAAIAISYLDRQALPVAVQAIGRDIPLTNGQFSALQSAFLFSYALMYAGGGKLVDWLGTGRGFTVVFQQAIVEGYGEEDFSAVSKTSAGLSAARRSNS